MEKIIHNEVTHRVVISMSELSNNSFEIDNSGNLAFTKTELTEQVQAELRAKYKLKYDELIAELPYEELREKRNKLLVESDWTQFRDVVLADDEAWKTYRQALRDLPSQVEPKLNEDIDALFPTKPGQ